MERDNDRFIYTDEDMNGLVITKNGDELENMLFDISINNVDKEGLEEAFYNVAKELLQKSKLIAGEAEYKIREIEFYFSGKYYDHVDPYVHSEQYGNTETPQSEFGDWYFHRFVSKDTYTHNRRGVDITFGNEELQNYGGILIRAISPMTGNAVKPIQGPSNVVNAIKGNLDDANSEWNMNDIAKGKNKFVFNPKSPLRIVPFEQGASEILSVKRYGLSEDRDIKYHGKKYRYFSKDYLKEVKGKELIFRELVKEGLYDIVQAREIIGYKISL